MTKSDTNNWFTSQQIKANKHEGLNQDETITAAIVGATGYTGVELIRLLSTHPQVHIKYLTSRSEVGRRVDDVFPSLRGITNLCYSRAITTTAQSNDSSQQQLAQQQDEDEQLADLTQCDVVFFATPHGVAMQQAQALVDAGVKVIDLAADFRLQSLSDFKQWYKQSHSCPELLKQAVYGIPEINRERLASANVVGNPGCYPTTAILGLKPVIETQNQAEQRLIATNIIIDAKSGVSGAGRKGDLALSYAETSDSFHAYGVAGHRHLPEIEQGVKQLLASRFEQRIRFVPHLLPMIRGMFTTIHLQLTDSGKNIDWHAVFTANYANEHFIDVLPKGTFPDTRSVRASNQMRIGVHQDDEVLTVLVVQDNLMKGAAGQAVQSMNVLFGFDERAGLAQVPLVP